MLEGPLLVLYVWISAQLIAVHTQAEVANLMDDCVELFNILVLGILRKIHLFILRKIRIYFSRPTPHVGLVAESGMQGGKWNLRGCADYGLFQRRFFFVVRR